MMPDYEKMKLVVLDVDGTLTDGGIYYDSQGNEMKRFDVKDGLGIKVGIAAGLEFAILTGRESPMVERRVKELGIHYLLSGVQLKYPVLRTLLRELNLSEEEVCYIGDDLNDLECMEHAGFSACPADAAEEIKAVADYVSSHNGGYGAVRDCLAALLKEKKVWPELAKRLYRSELA